VKDLRIREGNMKMINRLIVVDLLTYHKLSSLVMLHALSSFVFTLAKLVIRNELNGWLTQINRCKAAGYAGKATQGREARSSAV